MLEFFENNSCQVMSFVMISTKWCLWVPAAPALPYLVNGIAKGPNQKSGNYIQAASLKQEVVLINRVAEKSYL